MHERARPVLLSGERRRLDKRAQAPYIVAPVAELPHLVAEPSATDDLLDPHHALGITVTRA